MKVMQVNKNMLKKGWKRGNRQSFILRVSYGYNTSKIILFPRGPSKKNVYKIKEYPTYAVAIPYSRGFRLVLVENAYLDDVFLISGFVDYDGFCQKAIVGVRDDTSCRVCHDEKEIIIWDADVKDFRRVDIIEEYRKADIVESIKKLRHTRRLLYEYDFLKSFRSRLDRLVDSMHISEEIKNALFNLIDQSSQHNFGELPHSLRKINSLLESSIVHEELRIENTIQKILEGKI